MVLSKKIRLRFADGSERSIGDDDAKRLAVLLRDEIEHGATSTVAAAIEHELDLRFGTRVPVDVPDRSELGVTKALGELWL